MRDIPICDRLYELAKSKEKTSSEMSWEVRELKECTFRPAINKRPPIVAHAQNSENASEQKHIQRVRQKLIDQRNLKGQTQIDSENTQSSVAGQAVHKAKPKSSKDLLQVRPCRNMCSGNLILFSFSPKAYVLNHCCLDCFNKYSLSWYTGWFDSTGRYGNQLIRWKDCAYPHI